MLSFFFLFLVSFCATQAHWVENDSAHLTQTHRMKSTGTTGPAPSLAQPRMMAKDDSFLPRNAGTGTTGHTQGLGGAFSSSNAGLGRGTVNTAPTNAPKSALKKTDASENAPRQVKFADEGASVAPANARSQETIIGIDKPFRNTNTTHAPDAVIVEKMNSLQPHPNMDCSEIADILHNAAGKGRIIQVTGKDGARLKLFENGKVSDPEFVYHQVFTDSQYVYDPLLSKTAVPVGDWKRLIRALNPGAIIR